MTHRYHGFAPLTTDAQRRVLELVEGSGGMTFTADHTDFAYDGFWLYSLTPEQHERTCGYWYGVQTFGCTPHTAFRTLAALMRWLEVRGLYLTADLPAHGKHGTQRIPGRYIDRMHRSLDTMPHAGRQILKLSNAEYTLGVVTVESGVRVVNYCNPNEKRRRLFPHQLAREWEDTGASGLPSL